MSFAAPLWLLVLPLPLILLAFRLWYRSRSGNEAVLMHSLADHSPDQGLLPSLLGRLPEWLLCAALLLGIVALARPVSHSSEQELDAEGIDLVLCMDMSGSMRAMDFEPNRFEAARQVARDFISGREHDRIGLIVFAGEAYTQCPLSLDHDLLDRLLVSLQLGRLEDGTAIGLAMATALNRLRESEAASRVMILLTDGVNNTGLDPRTAMDMAHDLGVRVYTIGVGTDRGTAPMPVQTPFGVQTQQVRVDIDEALLQEIAERTDGRYFRARDLDELQAVYEEIDRLETTEYTVTEYRLTDEHFRIWLWLALVLLGLERLLRVLVRRLPA